MGVMNEKVASLSKRARAAKYGSVYYEQDYETGRALPPAWHDFSIYEFCVESIMSAPHGYEARALTEAIEKDDVDAFARCIIDFDLRHAPDGYSIMTRSEWDAQKLASA